MKAFVTGATGFVGGHVARLLAEQGAELRLLARASSRLDNLEGLSADIVRGDLNDAEALRRGMQGCDAVFHIAADYRLFVKDPSSMMRANVDGSALVVKTAAECAVRRVVYTSSVAVLGFKHERVVIDEDSPVTERDMIGVYKLSKFLAEKKVLELARSGAPVVVVNPSSPIGEGDLKPTPTGVIVADFLKGKFPVYEDTGLNVADVRSVARGHLLAFERGRLGERYILGGENLTLKQILDLLGEITGLPSPNICIPHWVGVASGYVDEYLRARLLGLQPRVTVDEAKMARKFMWVSSAKAERELGYQCGPAKDALRRAAEWFAAHEYAPDYRAHEVRR